MFVLRSSTSTDERDWSCSSVAVCIILGGRKKRDSFYVGSTTLNISERHHALLSFVDPSNPSLVK